MSRRNEMLSVFALLLPFAFAAGLTSLATGSAVAADEAAELCASAGVKVSEGGRGACTYIEADAAPQLGQAVCWNGQTARLKGTAPCIGSERTYDLRYGEVVDPQTGELAAYVPVKNACLLIECDSSSFDSQNFDDGIACCDPDTGDCYPSDDGDCSVGDITWCKELEDNGDGSVTCHE